MASNQHNNSDWVAPLTVVVGIALLLPALWLSRLTGATIADSLWAFARCISVIAVFGLLLYFLKWFSYGLLLAVCCACAWILVRLGRAGYIGTNCPTDGFFHQVCDFPWYFNGWLQASFFIPAIVVCLWWAYQEWNDPYY